MILNVWYYSKQKSEGAEEFDENEPDDVMNPNFINVNFNSGEAINVISGSDVVSSRNELEEAIRNDAEKENFNVSCFFYNSRITKS